MADCLFCKIVTREIPASIVYEDDRMLAFNDINPQAPTHVLVIPKRHIPSLNDLSDGDDAIVGEMVRRGAAIAAERGYAERGYRAVFNCNQDGGQSVFARLCLFFQGVRRRAGQKSIRGSFYIALIQSDLGLCAAVFPCRDIFCRATPGAGASDVALCVHA